MASDNPDNKLLKVQYFEQAYFEYHPEKAGTSEEVQVLPGGTQLAEQKGYFTGSYPRYGYAADFAWVAGRMRLHVPPGLSIAESGCSIVEYEPRISSIQLEGNIWRTYEFTKYYMQDPVRNINTWPGLVVFGHMASPSEARSPCLAAKSSSYPSGSAIYIVDTFHANPMTPRVGIP